MIGGLDFRGVEIRSSLRFGVEGGWASITCLFNKTHILQIRETNVLLIMAEFESF